MSKDANKRYTIDSLAMLFDLSVHPLYRSNQNKRKTNVNKQINKTCMNEN